jgi:hypothetical protein
VVLPLPDLSNGLLSVGGSNAASIACNLSRPRHHRLSLRLTDYGHSRPPLCLRRPAADPCEIIVAADLPLPVAVHEVVPWQAPDRFDEMALQGAVLENAADMARAYPELWETPKAAEHDKARRTPPNSFIDTLLKASGGLLIRYQPVGAGQKVRRVWFDRAVFHDPRAWLEGRLGPLAKYEVLVMHESSDAAAEPVS